MKLNTRTETVVSCQDWDKFVREAYGRPYCFQQQDGCRSRGVFRFVVPDEPGDFDNDTVSEVVNGPDQGVSFKAWLKRDPKAPLRHESSVMRNDAFGIELWWHRNFYPDIQIVANDLHSKGLLEAGEYTIDIDW